jgi:hypothetical protein
VRRISSVSPISVAAASAIVTRSRRGIWAPPIDTPCCSQSDGGTPRDSGPTVIRAPFWSRMLTASEATSNVTGEAPRSGRKAIRSVSSDTATTATTVPPTKTTNGWSRSRYIVKPPTMISSP